MRGGKRDQGKVGEFQGGEEQRIEETRGQEAFSNDQCVDSSSANEKAEEENEATKDRQLPKETGASRNVIDRYDHNELGVLSEKDRIACGSNYVEEDGLEGASDEETKKDEDTIEERGFDGSERSLILTGNSSPRDVNGFSAWNSDARETERGWGRDGKNKDPRGGEREEEGANERPAPNDKLGSERSDDGRLGRKVNAGPANDTAVRISPCHVRKQHTAFASETRGADDPSGQDALSRIVTKVGPPTAASGSGEGLPYSDVVPTSRSNATASAIKQLETTHEEPCRLNLDAPADSVVVKGQVNEESSNLVEQAPYSSSNEPCHNATASSSADRPLQTWSTTASDGGSIVRGLCLGAESDDGTIANARVIETPELDCVIEHVGNGAEKCAQTPSHPAIPDVSMIRAISVSRESRELEKQLLSDSEEDIEQSEGGSRCSENREVNISSQRWASDKCQSFIMDVPALVFPEAVLCETSENGGNPNALSQIGRIDGAVKTPPESEVEGSLRQDSPFDCPEAPPQQMDSMRAAPEDENGTSRQKGAESISVADVSTPAAVLCKEYMDPHDQSDQSKHSHSDGDPASGNASASKQAVGHTTPVGNKDALITSGRAINGDEWLAIVTRSCTGNAQLYDGPGFQAKVDLNESRAHEKEAIIRNATCFIEDQTAAKNNAWPIEEGYSEEEPSTRMFAGDGPSAIDRSCQTSWNKEIGTQTMPS